MNHSLPVRFFQRVRNVRCNFECFIDWQGSLSEPLRKGFPFQILHYQIPGTVLFTDIVKRADMRMIEGCNRTRLTFEALLRLRVRPELFVENLYRNRAVQACIEGFVNLGHASGSDGRDYFVRPELRS